LVLQLQSLVSISQQERIDVENSGEVKGVIDFLRRQGSLIVYHPIYLEKESLWSLLDPCMLVHPNDLSLFIAIIIDARDSHLFTGLIEVLVFHVHEEQTEQLLFSFVYLSGKIGTCSASFMKWFSSLPMNC
jgi:hypothetical protein